MLSPSKRAGSATRATWKGLSPHALFYSAPNLFGAARPLEARGRENRSPATHPSCASVLLRFTSPSGESSDLDFRGSVSRPCLGAIARAPLALSAHRIRHGSLSR